MSTREKSEESSNTDEVFEISGKHFEKISETLKKAGYAEGVTDGQTSIFQGSFDKGYEDGFRNGFLLGRLIKIAPSEDNQKPERGNCQICVDSTLLEKEESEIQERHTKITEKIQEQLKQS